MYFDYCEENPLVSSSVWQLWLVDSGPKKQVVFHHCGEEDINKGVMIPGSLLLLVMVQIWDYSTLSCLLFFLSFDLGLDSLV